MAPSPLKVLTIASDLSGLSPMAVRDLHLAKRAPAYKVNPAEGSKPPQTFNNLGAQVGFALVGIFMTLGALWFFFIAKNGGFKWRQNDWEDYKSTVLRRKGPDGKTLSNATKSTRLGGGSVVHGGSYGAESSVGYTDETGTSADMSEMREAEEGKSRRAFGIRGGDGRREERKEKKEKRLRHQHGNDHHDPELREYRQERPARVGGINREADGMYSDFASQPSELGSNVSARPLIKDKDKKPKDKKQEAKDKERRAKERMRKAKLAEKEALKTAAAAAKAQKEADKAAAKKEKADQKKAKKSRRADTEPTPSEAPPMTEYTACMTEYTAPSEAGSPSAPRRSAPSAAYSFVTGDDRTVYTGDGHTVYSGDDRTTYTRDDQTVYTGVYTDNPSETRTAPSEGIPESSYYSEYRPNGNPSARRSSRTRSRTRESRESRTRPSGSRPNSQSPRKQHRSSRSAALVPASAPPSAPPSDIFTAANGDPHGTMSYPCHIPGLSSAGSVGVSESVSQVGGPSSRRPQRDVMVGYRRGGVRTVRRDSLSDSDA